MVGRGASDSPFAPLPRALVNRTSPSRSSLVSLLIALAFAGCTRAAPTTERIRLLAPDGGAVTDRCLVDDDSREARRLAPGEELRVRLRIPPNATLRYAAAAPAELPAELIVTVTPVGSAATVRDAVAATGHWQDRTVDLAPVAGREVEVVARAAGGPVCWGAPAVVGAVHGPSLVVVVLLDTVRADHLSLYGYPRPTTPNLQQLALQAITFTDAASDVSWTRGSVATLMTGQPSMVHGVLNRDAVLDAAHPTMAELFRGRGFRTVALSTNPNVLPVWGFGRGFDRFVDVDAEHWSANADAARVLEAARATVRNAGDEPLFLYVHLNDAHAPYDPPADVAKKLLGAYGDDVPGKNLTQTSDPPTVKGAVDRYDAEIANMDAHLGAFFLFLDAERRWRDSLLVIVGDHGEEFRDHGGIYHGHTLFREQLHVPLLVKLPELAGAGARIAAPVSVIDVLPTMLGVLGGTVADLPGRVLLDGQGRSVPGTSMPRYATTDMDGTTVYAVEDAAATLIVETQPRQRTWLFDRVADPLQWGNIANQETDHLARLRLLLDERFAAHRRGWHVRVCGGSAPESVTVRIDGAAVEKLERIDLEPEDRVEVTEDGSNIMLTSDLRPQQRQEEFFGKLVRRPRPDTDELVFQSAGDIELAFGGSPVPVMKGLSTTPVNAPVVKITGGEALTPAVYAPACPKTPAVLAWQVGNSTATESVDPQVLDRLRALGYAH